MLAFASVVLVACLRVYTHHTSTNPLGVFFQIYPPWSLRRSRSTYPFARYTGRHYHHFLHVSPPPPTSSMKTNYAKYFKPVLFVLTGQSKTINTNTSVRTRTEKANRRLWHSLVGRHHSTTHENCSVENTTNTSRL